MNLKMWLTLLVVVTGARDAWSWGATGHEWISGIAIEKLPADRGLDHRRHGFSEEGPAFSGGGASVLRPARQARQLPGRGFPVDCQPRGEPAGGLPSFLPEAWASDARRRKKAKVPEDVAFQTK